MTYRFISSSLVRVVCRLSHTRMWPALSVRMWTVATAIAVMVTVTTADEAAPAPDAEKWAQVVAGRKAATEAIESIRFSFVTTLRAGPVEQPRHSQRVVYELAVQGEKKYFRHFWDGGDQQKRYVAVSDGAIVSIRDDPPIADRRLFRTRDTARRIYTTSLPHEIIEYQTPDQLQERAATGIATLLSVEDVRLEGENCIKATWKFHSRPDYTEQVEVWYAVDHSYLPLRTEVHHPDRGMIGLGNDIKFQRIAVGDGFVSYPTSGQWEGFHDGKSNWHHQFTVEVPSLRINAAIPDNLFILRPEPGERIYDGDTGAIIAHPEDGVHGHLLNRPSPQFELDLLDGGRMSMAQHKDGQIVILDFWATWCGGCISAMPGLIDVAERYQDQGVELYAVNLREEPQRVREFVEKQQWSLKVPLDRGGAVAKMFAVEGVPQTVIVGRDGAVKSIQIGGGGWRDEVRKERLAEELDALLAEQ